MEYSGAKSRWWMGDDGVRVKDRATTSGENFR
jgi:hypothetical protein